MPADASRIEFGLIEIAKTGGTTTLRLSRDAYVKQVILFRARNKGMPDLPILIDDLPCGTPAEHWYHALTSDNPPGKCRFDFRKDHAGFLAFRAEVEALDFSAYDPGEADRLREKYGREAKAAPAGFDAADAELEE